MENQKLKVAMNEISEFIKSRMNGLLKDLLIESNEYEETKQCILGLPFVKQLIQNTLLQNAREPTYDYSSIFNNDSCQLKDASEFEDSVDLEELIILNKSFQEVEETEPENKNNSENIYLHISEQRDEPRCICCGGNRDMVNEKCLTCLEDCDTCKNDCESQNVDEVVEEINVNEIHDEEIGQVLEEEVEEEEQVLEEEVEEEEQVLEEEVEEEEQVHEEEEQVKESQPVVSQVIEEEVEEEEEPAVVVEPVTLEVAEEEDEEDEVFEIEIDDVTYFTTNEKSGVIYSSDENGDPDKEVGVFQNGKAIFHK
jgi:hypothetical protein